MSENKTIEVFFSYSHKDESLLNELSNHLTVLKRKKEIKAWHDRNITAGNEWKNEIEKQLNSAQIILLLISSDFLASDFCWGVELKQAMKRHEAGDAHVIPIILRDVDWHEAPFAKLQALPKDAKPVTTWPDRDQAFTDIARGISRVVEELARKSLTKSQNRDEGFTEVVEEIQKVIEEVIPKQSAEVQEVIFEPVTTSIPEPLKTTKWRLRLQSFHWFSLLKFLGTSMGVTALVVLTRLSAVLEPVELFFFDQMMRLPRREDPDERLLLIKITPEDQQKYGIGQGTSLPDKTIGELLKTLVNLKPRAIGLDLYREFPTQDKDLKQLLKTESNIFAVCKVAAPESNSLGTTPPPEVPPERIGFSDFSEDRDHVVRRQLLRMDTKNIDKSPCGNSKTMDSLSFKLAQQYLSKDKKEYKSTKNSINLASDNIVLQRLFGSTTGGYQSMERLLGAYQVLLNYRPACRRGNTSVPECSPHKIAQREMTVKEALENKLLNKDSVEDKIVLIGTRIDGIDFLLPTPFSFGEREPRMPGLIMQAQMVSQLVSAVKDERPLLRVWSIEYEIGWILLWSIVGGIVAQFCPSNKILILSGIVAVASLYVICLIFFTQIQLWIPLIPTAFSLLGTGGFVVVLIRLKAQKLS